MAEVDLELRKQFQELQMKVIETRTKMRQIDAGIEQLNRSSQRCKLTESEIKSLPKDVNTYKTVGRMFLKATREQVYSDFEQTVRENGKKCNELEKKKKFLEDSLKEKENNLREIINQKQNKTN